MNYRDWDEMAADLAGARIGLVAHQASVDELGRHTAERLRPARLFGPEHGFFGWGGAGEEVLDARHPWLGVPVRSLYGEHRRPPREWIEDLDVLVFDLQDLGVRCYTFVSTLKHVLEAAADGGPRVVVIDRPVPLPGLLDGPMLDGDCRSFVGMVDAPFCYGLTPGQAARWMVRRYGLAVDLRVLPTEAVFDARIPPSPAIRSWMAAAVYPATVFCEATPALDCDRGGLIPFQTLCAPWLDPDAVPELAGARVHRHVNRSLHPGIRITVTDARRWRPVAASVRVLASLPAERLWEGAREDFFDLLYGTRSVREGLQAGRPAEAIVADWRDGLAGFAEEVGDFAPEPRRAAGD